MSNNVSSNKRDRGFERDEANLQYFLSLANSRAALTGLPTLAFLNMVFLGLDQLFVYSVIYEGNREFESLFDVNNALIMFGFLVFLLSLIKPLTFRFQIASSALLAVLAVVVVYSLCLMFLCLGTMVEGASFTMVYSLKGYAIFGVLALLYVGGATFVHVFLLRKRLREGHSETRTMGNFMAASSVYNSKSLWIIFAVVMVGPNVLTGGEYVMLTFGLLGFLFLASVLTSLPVEFGYLAFLKSRDKRYWQPLPPKIAMERDEKVAILKKVAKWVLIVLAVIVVLVLLPVIWP